MSKLNQKSTLLIIILLSVVLLIAALRISISYFDFEDQIPGWAAGVLGVKQSSITDVVPPEVTAAESLQTAPEASLLPQPKPKSTDVKADSSAAKSKAKTPKGWVLNPEDSLYYNYEHPKGAKALEPGDGYFIRVVKSKRQLTLFKDGNPVKVYAVGVGKNSGDKAKPDDDATPEGNFHIQSIHYSKDWLYKGVKAYGEWFLRLNTNSGTFSGKPWTGIGIHGTINENSIGHYVSKGCIRMYNKDIRELKQTVEEAVKTSQVPVVILP